MVFNWTKAVTDQAKKMYLDGGSATEIALAIGAPSRSAVLGKLHREGVSKSGSARHLETLRLQAARRVAADRERAAKRAERQAKADAKRRAEEERQAARLISSAEKRIEWKDDPMPVHVDCSPRVWAERVFGECAYPVSGSGAETMSCCNPVYGDRQYCRGHHRVMFEPKKLSRVRPYDFKAGARKPFPAGVSQDFDTAA